LAAQVKNGYNNISLLERRKIDMGFIGLGISIAAGFFMLIGLIPFLGWLNWITTLPLALIGATFSALGITRSRSILGMTGLIISMVVFFFGVARLAVGCGVF
jgi:hypothetical protein